MLFKKNVKLAVASTAVLMANHGLAEQTASATTELQKKLRTKVKDLEAVRQPQGSKSLLKTKAKKHKKHKGKKGHDSGSDADSSDCDSSDYDTDCEDEGKPNGVDHASTHNEHVEASTSSQGIQHKKPQGSSEIEVDGKVITAEKVFGKRDVMGEAKAILAKYREMPKGKIEEHEKIEKTESGWKASRSMSFEFKPAGKKHKKRCCKKHKKSDDDDSGKESHHSHSEPDDDHSGKDHSDKDHSDKEDNHSGKEDHHSDKDHDDSKKDGHNSD